MCKLQFCPINETVYRVTSGQCKTELQALPPSDPPYLSLALISFRVDRRSSLMVQLRLLYMVALVLCFSLLTLSMTLTTWSSDSTTMSTYGHPWFFTLTYSTSLSQYFRCWEVRIGRLQEHRSCLFSLYTFSETNITNVSFVKALFIGCNPRQKPRLSCMYFVMILHEIVREWRSLFAELPCTRHWLIFVEMKLAFALFVELTSLVDFCLQQPCLWLTGDLESNIPLCIFGKTSICAATGWCLSRKRKKMGPAGYWVK